MHFRSIIIVLSKIPYLFDKHFRSIINVLLETLFVFKKYYIRIKSRIVNLVANCVV